MFKKSWQLLYDTSYTMTRCHFLTTVRNSWNNPAHTFVPSITESALKHQSLPFFQEFLSTDTSNVIILGITYQTNDRLRLLLPSTTLETTMYTPYS